jgi:hypothetical protein
VLYLLASEFNNFEPNIVTWWIAERPGRGRGSRGCPRVGSRVSLFVCFESSFIMRLMHSESSVKPPSTDPAQILSAAVRVSTAAPHSKVSMTPKVEPTSPRSHQLLYQTIPLANIRTSLADRPYIKKNSIFCKLICKAA